MTDRQTPPICPYCNQPSHLASSREVYGGRDYGPIWLCGPCKAWVGCHKGTHRPLGRLANQRLRGLKIQAHSHFDKLWRRGPMRRGDAYRWLAESMGLTAEQAHIGLFDEAQCEQLCRLATAKLNELSKALLK